MKKHLQKTSTLYLLLMSAVSSYSQNIGINQTGATPHASSVLDLNTGNTFTSPNGKGILPPKVALTSITDAVTVTSPATSLLVYNTATAGTGTAAVVPGYYYWSGTQWVANTGNDWKTTGNVATTAGTNFIGTTDAVDFVTKTNNTERMRVTSTGNVGIGTAAPNASALVDMTSTTMGFAMPRMTSVQRKAIVTPAAGLMVYDTNLKGYYTYNGTKWDCANNPAGTMDYFANSTAPNGYLECNGQAVSRTTYAELFAAIGTVYGVGDGSTTFNVPDLRGEFVRGWDNGRGVDAGRVIGTKQPGSLIVGDFDGISTVNLITVCTLNPAAGFDKVGADPVIPSDYLPGTVGFQNAGPVSPGSFASRPDLFGVSRPRNVALMPCIKY